MCLVCAPLALHQLLARRESVMGDVGMSYGCCSDALRMLCARVYW